MGQTDTEIDRESYRENAAGISRETERDSERQRDIHLCREIPTDTERDSYIQIEMRHVDIQIHTERETEICLDRCG